MSALTLGRVLQLKGIPFTIFERDSSANTRSQGGTLDLETGGGQLALHKAELHDKFRANMRVSGQAVKLATKDATFVLEHYAEETDESRPEIDRGILRKFFLDVVGNSVKWSARVTSITKQEGGGYKLGFADGTSQVFDLVVGADGCFSTIRPAISSDRPGYTGVTLFEMWITGVFNHPKEAALIGPGSMFALGDHKGIFCQVNDGGKIRIAAVISLPEYWHKQFEKTYDWSNPKGDAKTKLIEEFYSDWAPELRALISATESDVWPRPLYYLPVGHRWVHTPGLTLIGDAAHVMSPAAGEGANIAMLDGALLGEAIAEGLANGGGDALEKSIQGFEESMFERATKAAAMSEANLRTSMKPDGAHGMAEMFKARAAAAQK